MRAEHRRLRAPEIPVERFELGSGALLLVSRREGAPVTAIRAHLRGGHSLDAKGLEGTAYLAGALADQGTKRHSEEELATLLEPAGGQLGGDANGLGGSIAGADTELLLDLFCEVLTQPTFPRAKVERQRARLAERLDVEQRDPRARSARLFKRLVYGDHWLGRAAYGNPDSIARIERKHVAAHHRKHWCGKRTVIAVCGDVDPQAIRRRLDRGLSAYRIGKDLPPPLRDFPAPGPRSAAFQADRQQVHVFLGHLGIRRSDPDYEALVVMDHVLGTGPGFTSRITRRLRDELGLAYAVHASIHDSAGVLPGTFTAYIGTSPQNVATAVAGFVEEIRRIQREPVSRAELELARNYLLGSLAMGFERATQRVGYLLTAERNHLPPDYLEQLPRRFEAVTAEDLQRVARAHLLPDRTCVATGGPIAEKELRALLAGLDRGAAAPAPRKRRGARRAGRR